MKKRGKTRRSTDIQERLRLQTDDYLVVNSRYRNSIKFLNRRRKDLRLEAECVNCGDAGYWIVTWTKPILSAPSWGPLTGAVYEKPWKR